MIKLYFSNLLFISLILLVSCDSNTDKYIDNAINDPPNIELSYSYISEGYSDSRINSTSFRQHSLHTIDGIQIATFYNSEGFVTISRKTLEQDIWNVYPTLFEAFNINDPHDVISFGVDGDNYVHMSWGMHNNPLNYAISDFPITSIELPITFTKFDQMVGHENTITYPQFYECTNGDLLFLFRKGVSGAGDLYLNRYSLQTKTWSPVHGSLNDPLPIITGIEDDITYNPYNQPMIFDNLGRLHLSWLNRYNSTSPSGEIAFQTNHNIYYAISGDEGVTWKRSSGEQYTIPITEFGVDTAAEVVIPIKEGSSLINQTSMAVDNSNNPIIMSWWAPLIEENNHTRQYMITYYDGRSWSQQPITSFIEDYDSNNDGVSDKISESQLTKYLMARPIVFVDNDDRVYTIYTDYRDNNSITLGYSSDKHNWKFTKVNENNMGLWEPNYDLSQWNLNGEIHMLYQPTGDMIKTSSIEVLRIKFK